MEILRQKNELALLLALAVTLSFWSSVAGQVPVVTKPPANDPASVESKATAPQVITVLHRIDGLKMLRLLIRSGEEFAAVENWDQAIQMADQVHTSIIAGLTLDDGQTIAAWLPEAEVEVESSATWTGVTSATRPFVVGVPGSINAFPGFNQPDITIIGRDGTRHKARYVGLDGLTGMSLLKLLEKGASSPQDVKELEILVGQRVRLFSPQPVPENGGSRNDAVYVRIGETQGQVVSVERGHSGAINRIRIKSGKLSPSNIGGVAVSDEGQTIGIVESIEGAEGNVLPAAVIRAAAKRVLARQTSVPRPWLGVSGESVASASLAQIVRQGWETRRAMSLLEKQSGILLTWVSPGSPAAVASLREGDVIESVNENEVKSRDDFTLLLAEAGDAPLRLAIARPGNRASELITVKLAEPADPLFAFNSFGPISSPRLVRANPLLGQGIETVPLRAVLRSRPGVSAGLLVVFVRPGSAAFTAGLLPGDVIEAIDGRKVLPATAVIRVAPSPGASTSPPWPIIPKPSALEPLNKPRYTLDVLRNKEKVVITVVARQE